MDATGLRINITVFDLEEARDTIMTEYDFSTDSMAYENLFVRQPENDQTVGFGELFRAIEELCQQLSAKMYHVLYLLRSNAPKLENFSSRFLNCATAQKYNGRAKRFGRGLEEFQKKCSVSENVDACNVCVMNPVVAIRSQVLKVGSSNIIVESESNYSLRHLMNAQICASAYIGVERAVKTSSHS